MGVEFYYTGETELISVENGRPEGENVQCLLEEVGPLWDFPEGHWVYPRTEIETTYVRGISNN